ncbi:MAG: winged helix-turn-helix domain-containing protein [Zestosphaera sp.]
MLVSEEDVGESIESADKSIGEAAAKHAYTIDPYAIASEVLSSNRLLRIFAVLRLGGCATDISRESGVPPSSTLRFLRRLAEAGVVEVVSGLDRRKKFYKLSDLGMDVLKHVKHVITDSVDNKGSDKYVYVEENKFSDLARKLGVDVELLARLLNASKERKTHEVLYRWAR